jgi:hypothetical protein
MKHDRNHRHPTPESQAGMQDDADGILIVAVAPYLPSTLSRNERMVRATETPAQSGRAFHPT